MLLSAARWVLRRPRLLYAALVPGAMFGLASGFFPGGEFGGFCGTFLGLWASGYLYVTLRFRLQLWLLNSLTWEEICDLLRLG